MKHPNGDEFEGFYKNNQKDGYGIMKFINGEIKEGLWKNDKFVGDVEAVETGRIMDSTQDVS